MTGQMCQKWFVKFCAGDFWLDDAPWPGRPVEVDSNQIKILIKNNKCSTMCYNIDCSQLMSLCDLYQFQPVYLTVEQHPVRNLWHQTSQTTFDTFDRSQHLLHILHKSFFFFCHFSCVFTFLEIIKHNMTKMLHIFFHLQY